MNYSAHCNNTCISHSADIVGGTVYKTKATSAHKEEPMKPLEEETESNILYLVYLPQYLAINHLRYDIVSLYLSCPIVVYCCGRAYIINNLVGIKMP